MGLNPIAWPSPDPDLTQERGMARGTFVRSSCGFVEVNLPYFSKVLRERMIKGKGEMEIFSKICQITKP